MMCSFGISERATQSERHYKYVYQRLSQLCEELDELLYKVENDNVFDGLVNESNVKLNTSQDKTLF